MPGLVATGHSHRPTTKVTNKSFKSRKATKGSLRDAAKGMSHAGAEMRSKQKGKAYKFGG
jgi:hypothetical protein